MPGTYVDNGGVTRDALGVFLTDTAASAVGMVYRRAAAVSATAGQGVLITAALAGTVVLTLAGGGTATMTVMVGSTILPFAVTAAAAGTSTGATFQSLFTA